MRGWGANGRIAKHVPGSNCVEPIFSLEWAEPGVRGPSPAMCFDSDGQGWKLVGLTWREGWEDEVSGAEEGGIFTAKHRAPRAQVGGFWGMEEGLPG